MRQLFDKPGRQDKMYTQPRVPDGQRVYAVGDIHGRADLLAQMHEIIAADAMAYAGRKTVVYLGDFIDRGDESRQVVERLVANPLEGFEAIHLLGNHENTMLKFLQSPERYLAWLTWGGMEMLHSYGVSLKATPRLETAQELGELLRNALPDSHLALFQGCREDWSCGSYYFVHAGIRPGVPLDKQTLRDKLEIRYQFLDSSMDHGCIVVHGHTITDEPELYPNRIGLDTGAFATGILSAVALEGSGQRILQVK